MAEGYFDTAQICKNGHVVNDSVKRLPESCANFCAKCGEPTVTECEGCQAPIRGYFQVPGVIGYMESKKVAPNFCHNCGKPYPWTDRWLKTTGELVAELDELQPADRELLQHCLGDLIRQGPPADLAAMRTRKLLKKLNKETFETVKSVTQELLSESARKTLFSL